jgi:uncharacterized membrane protein
VDIGPLHLVVIDFDERRFEGEVMPELRALRETGVIRLVDLLLVRRDDRGRLRELPLGELVPDEVGRYGALLRPLLAGMPSPALRGEGRAVPPAMGATPERDGDPVLSARDLLDLEARIPPGGSAALLLLEHAWAARLVEAVIRAGGRLAAEGMVSLETLASLGIRVEAEVGGRV